MRRSRWNASKPAPSSTNTAPPPWPTSRRHQKRTNAHAADPMPQLRPAGRNRIPLRGTGPRPVPREPQRAERHGVVPLPLLPGEPQRHLRRALGPQHHRPGRSDQVTSQNARLATGGRIDRTISWRFTVDGEEFTGHPGDTLASALLANGRIAAGNSLYEDRPRGIMSAGVEEANALVRVEARFPGHVAESMLPATTVSLVDGLQATLLNGLGKLDPEDDRAEYDKKYVHTDVLVIGGGPAGLAAAREAVRTGARVMLLDDQPELSGSVLSGSTAPGLAGTIEGKPALEWVADVQAELVSGAESTVLNRTTAFGAYDANYVIAVHNRTDHLTSPAAPGVSRQRIWHVRAAQVVLAPGAHERPLVFENNDRPGIMLASAVRSYLNRYAVAAGKRVVIGTTNDSAYALAADLRAAGIRVEAVVDARAQLSETAAAAAAAGTRVLIGSAVANTTAAVS